MPKCIYSLQHSSHSALIANIWTLTPETWVSSAPSSQQSHGEGLQEQHTHTGSGAERLLGTSAGLEHNVALGKQLLGIAFFESHPECGVGGVLAFSQMPASHFSNNSLPTDGQEWEINLWVASRSSHLRPQKPLKPSEFPPFTQGTGKTRS